MQNALKFIARTYPTSSRSYSIFKVARPGGFSALLTVLGLLCLGLQQSAHSQTESQAPSKPDEKLFTHAFYLKQQVDKEKKELSADIIRLTATRNEQGKTSVTVEAVIEKMPQSSHGPIQEIIASSQTVSAEDFLIHLHRVEEFGLSDSYKQKIDSNAHHMIFIPDFLAPSQSKIDAAEAKALKHDRLFFGRALPLSTLFLAVMLIKQNFPQLFEPVFVYLTPEQRWYSNLAINVLLSAPLFYAAYQWSAHRTYTLRSEQLTSERETYTRIASQYFDRMTSIFATTDAQRAAWPTQFMSNDPSKEKPKFKSILNHFAARDKAIKDSQDPRYYDFARQLAQSILGKDPQPREPSKTFALDHIDIDLLTRHTERMQGLHSEEVIWLGPSGPLNKTPWICIRALDDALTTPPLPKPQGL